MTTTEQAPRRVIHLEKETPLSLTEAINHLPGKPTHQTVWRWTTEGVNGVRLPCVLIGRRRFTSLSAIQQFLDELAQATN